MSTELREMLDQKRWEISQTLTGDTRIQFLADWNLMEGFIVPIMQKYYINEMVNHPAYQTSKKIEKEFEEYRDNTFLEIRDLKEQITKLTPNIVTKRSEKDLIRNRVISVTHCSDDGEYIRYKVMSEGKPVGPELGEWNSFGEKLMVVDCNTVHANIVKMFPQLFEETK